MAGPAPSIRKATTCTHPPTFSSKPSRNARHKSACGSDWPTLTAPSFLRAQATTGCWSTASMRPTTCARYCTSCRLSPAPPVPCPPARRRPIRSPACRSASRRRSSSTWTSACRRCWCRWWTRPSRRRPWCAPRATPRRACAAWAAPWRAPRAGSPIRTMCTRPTSRYACWCRPKPCKPWATSTPLPPRRESMACSSARRTCRPRWAIRATPSTRACRPRSTTASGASCAPARPRAFWSPASPRRTSGWRPAPCSSRSGWMRSCWSAQPENCWPVFALCPPAGEPPALRVTERPVAVCCAAEPHSISESFAKAERRRHQCTASGAGKVRGCSGMESATRHVDLRAALFQGRCDLVHAAIDVALEQTRAARAVACLEGQQRLAMLVLCHPPVAALHVCPAHDMDARIHVAQHADHLEIAGHRHQALVKLLIERDQLVRAAPGCVRPGGIEKRQQCIDAPLLGAHQRQPDGRDLDGLAQLIQREDLVHIQVAAIKALAGNQAHQPFGVEAIERLAQRRPADAKLAREFALVEPFAGFDGIAYGHAPDLVVDPIGDAAARWLRVLLYGIGHGLCPLNARGLRPA